MVHLYLGLLSGRALHNYVTMSQRAAQKLYVRASAQLVFMLHRIDGQYTVKSAVTEPNDGQYTRIFLPV